MPPPLAEFSCLALRQAARHVTQFYDQCLAPTGLRPTQYSILPPLNRRRPLTLSALAAQLVMDPPTLRRHILPLDRVRLTSIVQLRPDRLRHAPQLPSPAA